MKQSKSKLKEEAIRLWKEFELCEVNTPEFDRLAEEIRKLHEQIGGSWSASNAVYGSRMKAFHGDSY
jgi:hypothetical protein